MYIFNNVSFDFLNSRSLPYGGLKFEYSSKTHCYFIVVGLHWLPMWQYCCYRASRELCSNYLLVNDNKKTNKKGKEGKKILHCHKTAARVNRFWPFCTSSYMADVNIRANFVVKNRGFKDIRGWSDVWKSHWNCSQPYKTAAKIPRCAEWFPSVISNIVTRWKKISAALHYWNN